MQLIGLSALACAASACHHDDSFLSLADLCPDRVADLCNARNNGCCTPAAAGVCENAELMACLAEQGALTAEAGRNYDSVAAEKQSEATRTAIGHCQSPLPLASYFEGGLANGTACERAAQCASGNCSGTPAVCVDAAPIALCTQ